MMPGPAETANQGGALFILNQERASLQAQLDWHHTAIWKAVEGSLRSLETGLSKLDAPSQDAPIRKHVTFAPPDHALVETRDVEMVESINSDHSNQDARQAIVNEREGSSDSCSVDDFCTALGNEAQRNGTTAVAEDDACQDSTTKEKQNRRKTRLSIATADIRALLNINSHSRPLLITRDPIRRWLHRNLQQRFEAFVGIMVLANTAVAFSHLQYLGLEADESLGRIGTKDRDVEHIFRGTEQTFAAIFTVELILRLYVARLDFFRSCLNILDALIVILTLLDLVYFSRMANTSTNISVLRLVRIVRVARVMRIARTLRAFQELRILLKTMQASVMAVFWSMCMMFLFMLMMAMLLCQLLHDFIISETEELQSRMDLNDLYGSGTKALQTVFKATFSGCWPAYSDPVVQHVGGYLFLVFAAYVIVVIFTMSRIVSSMFVGETLKQASVEAETMVRDKMREQIHITKKLDALFRTADTSQDGRLTEQELTHMFTHESVRMLFSKLGVDTTDGHFLFQLLDNGANGVSRDAFVSGVKRLKGEARSIDLVPLARDCAMILEHCKEMRRSIAESSAVPRCGRQMTFV
mmetsp:Transcript_126139/g.251942  ORF Transcript_126139/g.251942 Transcript_126139/m.251942 type:complete len:584 (-) Transcript_126139:108-1859(-)